MYVKFGRLKLSVLLSKISSFISMVVSLQNLSPETRKKKKQERKMLPSSLLLFILLISSFFLSLDSLSDSVSKSPSDSPNPPTVYDTLHQSGLPSGLLPDSVISYSLSSDGSFVVELEKACYIQFEYLVYYERRITGTIHYGSITDLKGIQVKGFLFWFNVNEIKVDLPPSNYIYFEVGWITKKLDVAQFRKVRSCGDGISSWKYLLKVPEPEREMAMLVTE